MEKELEESLKPLAVCFVIVVVLLMGFFLPTQSSHHLRVTTRRQRMWDQSPSLPFSPHSTVLPPRAYPPPKQNSASSTTDATPSPGKSILHLVLEQFDDKLVQILLSVALLSGVFSYYEMKAHVASTGEKIGLLRSFVKSIVILSILVLNATVGVWQGKSAQGSLEALKKLQPSLCTVLRHGEWVDGMDAADLVPGDVISFRVGDKISADARVSTLQSATLSLDEGSLTGESVTVQKLPGNEGLCGPNDPVQDKRGVVFSGTAQL